MKRIAAIAGCLAALTVTTAPMAAVAATTPALTLSSLNTGTLVKCRSTGVTGPTGKVSADVYAFKGAKPPRSAMSCARARAVIAAGRGDMFGKLRRSVDKPVSVAGMTYLVNEAILPGASGPAPAFVGHGTAIIAIYASGR